jgi:predicted nucleic acid-binding protein
LTAIVSDTSPVRAFAHLGRVDLFAALFGEVLVPPAVVRELELPTSKLPPLLVARAAPFVVRAPADADAVRRYLADLDPGESEALALAAELGATLLMDEARGRAVAARDGLPTVGTAGTLLLAKERGLIAAVKPLMETLRDETGFRISPAFFAEMLRLADER